MKKKYVLIGMTATLLIGLFSGIFLTVKTEKLKLQNDDGYVISHFGHDDIYAYDVESNVKKSDGSIDKKTYDENGIYYLFTSYDSNVEWTLTAKEIGFIPEMQHKYTITYNDNGTENIYDDTFISLN